MRTLLCSALVSTFLFGQGAGRTEVRSAGLAQGIQATFVLQVAQDREGRFWLATDKGVFRGDGRTFHPLRSPILPAQVGSLLVLEDGRVWMTTPQGLFLWEKGTIRASGLPRGEWSHLDRDDRGGVWALAGGVPWQWRDTTLPVPHPSWPAGRAGRVLVAGGGPVTVLGDGVMARLGEDGLWREGELPRHGFQATDAVQGADGTLWAHDGLRLFALNAGGWREVSLGRRVTRCARFHRDRDGRIWLATEEGPVQLGPTGPVWPLRDMEQVPFAGLHCVFVDRERNLWLGALGLHLVPGSPEIRQFGRWEGVTGSVWSLRRDRAGRLWAATQGGVVRAEARGWRTLLPGRYATRLEIGPDGMLWAGGGTVLDALLRVDPDTGTAEEIPCPGLGRLSFNRGLAFVKGEVWAAARDGGLWALAGSPGAWTWRRMDPPLSRPDDRGPRALLQDPAGRVWLACRRSLHGWWNGAWHEVVGLEERSPVVLAWQPGEEQLWVGYDGSPHFTLFRPGPDGAHRVGTWAGVPEREGVSLFSAAFQDRSTLWVGTSHGAIRVDLGKGGFRTFGKAEGLPGDDCDIDGLAFDPDGSVWVATSTGLGWLKGNLREGLPPLPPPALIQARSEGQALDPDGRLVLSPGGRGLDLLLASISPARQERLRYQVRLDGGGWEELSGGRLLLAGLSPGLRRVGLRALQEDGATSPERELLVEAIPAWWQRGWARLAFLLAGCATVWGAVRLRTRVLERRTRELERQVEARTADLQAAHDRLATASQAKSAFLAGMSHELRTPLNAILLYGELIREHAVETGDLQQADDADKVQGAGRHLLSLLNGVLDLSKIEAGKMGLSWEDTALLPVLSEVQQTMDPLVRQRGNAFRVIWDPDLGLIHTDAMRVRQILINLLGNASKFTENGVVTFRARRSEQAIQLEVEDTGIGMDAETLARVFHPYEQAGDSHALGTGLGLTLSLELTRLLGGTLEAVSEPGKGSRFRLTLPLVRAEAARVSRGD